MKKVYKNIILITGGSGLLGRFFKKKYKNKYKIISYPHRVEQFNKFNKWIKSKKFHYFIHFAGITTKNNKNYKKINLINTKSSIEILKLLNQNSIKCFKYFLFISTSHVYGYYKKKISEVDTRIPFSNYGISKKKVEDFILKNKKNFNFKIGIARIFNFTSHKQTIGHFIPDVYQKIKNDKYLLNLNSHRDFIHIDDVSRALELMIRKKYDRPLNICSGKKTNLIFLTKKLNLISLKKKIIFKNFKTNKILDIYGDNKLLKKLGIKKFKSLNSILKSFLYEKKKNINYR